MKLYLKIFLKIIAAGILALIVLELFCRVYFNKPLHTTNTDGTTDYVWEKNKFYSNWTEGIAWGKTNNEGFYNYYDYEPGMDVDVLVMGSSYMMAEQVQQNECTAYLLDKMMPDKTVYNIGTAGHYFLTNIDNMKAAIDKYSPEYVIIDTQVVTFSDEELQQILDGEYPELESEDSGFARLIQQSCLVRLLYYQLTFYSEQHGGLINPPELKPLFTKHTESVMTASSDKALVEEEDNHNYMLMSQMFERIGKLSSETGTKVIILYHPKTWLEEKGYMWVYDEAEKTCFGDLCRENGIYLVDMSERYLAEYEKNRILPYGFCNTEIAYGHLNVNGHKMVAEELYSLIREVD